MRKVCVVTGTRAEYGLLYWTMQAIKKSSVLDLQIVATGMHLSPEFGLTYQEIEKDGFMIDKKLEILLSSDSSIGISKSLGLGVISFSEAFCELKPDIVVLLGDRFEILSAAIAAMLSRIPIAHCHGGEATHGLIDEPIRHSITKMSQLHFTSTDIYRNRVIQLGEQPKFVFNVGALGIENINRLQLMNKEDFLESINFDFGGGPLFLITYHPVTLENNSSEQQVKNLLMALDNFPQAKLIFTKANADTDGRIINSMIDEYANKNSERAKVFTSLGQLRYLSALKFVDLVIGNSSSGLIEVPTFNKPTINIGDRQKGRLASETVIHSTTDVVSIVNSIKKGLSNEFIEFIRNVSNPYGEGNSSKVIVDTLESIDLEDIVKKEFYDISLINVK